LGGYFQSDRFTELVDCVSRSSRAVMHETNQESLDCKENESDALSSLYLLRNDLAAEIDMIIKLRMDEFTAQFGKLDAVASAEQDEKAGKPDQAWSGMTDHQMFVGKIPVDDGSHVLELDSLQILKSHGCESSEPLQRTNTGYHVPIIDPSFAERSRSRQPHGTFTDAEDVLKQMALQKSAEFELYHKIIQSEGSSHKDSKDNFAHHGHWRLHHHMRHHLRSNSCCRCIRNLVDSRWFDYCFGMAVLTNAIFIGIEVEHHGDQEAQRHFEKVGHAYNGVFFMELSMRIAAQGTEFFMIGNDMAWNYLDLTIVSLSILGYLMPGGGMDGSIALMRMARFVRLIRLVRIIRVMRFFRSLRILIYSIFGTLKSLVWAMFLLIMIIYVFGIVFTQAVNEHLDSISPDDFTDVDMNTDSLIHYFGTLPRSILTLFKCIAGGTSWEMVSDPLITHLHGTYVCTFLAYISFTCFAVLNVVTGFFCQNAIESAEKDDEEVIQAQLAEAKAWVHKLRTVFLDVDEFNDGCITLIQLEDYCRNERVVCYFDSLGIDVTDVWEIFKILDIDNSGGIGIDEFVNGCLKLRGAARSLEMHEMLIRMRWVMDHVAALSDKLGTSAPSKLPVMACDPRPKPKVTHSQSATMSSDGVQTLTEL